MTQNPGKNVKLPAQDDLFEIHLHEGRMFPPPAAFSAQARLKSLAEYERMYARSIENPEEFWAEAAEELEWFKRWERVLDEDALHARWFVGGKLNLAYNCLDRHVRGLRRDKIALIWEGEPCVEDGSAEVRRLTYGELLEQVQRFANVLKSLGVKKGDRVAVYMGMSPELAIAVLACARLGAVHLVIFAGFGPQAIGERVRDGDCAVVVTQDVSYRRGNKVGLKGMVDEALERCPDVRSVVVYQRAPGFPVAMKAGRDLGWHEAMAAASAACPPEWMDAEDPLFILYTSGTTGKPKGLVHTSGGYAVQTYLSTKYIFDLLPHRQRVRHQSEDSRRHDQHGKQRHDGRVSSRLRHGQNIMLHGGEDGAPNGPGQSHTAVHPSAPARGPRPPALVRSASTAGRLFRSRFMAISCHFYGFHFFKNSVTDEGSMFLISANSLVCAYSTCPYPSSTASAGTPVTGTP